MHIIGPGHTYLVPFGHMYGYQYLDATPQLYSFTKGRVKINIIVSLNRFKQDCPLVTICILHIRVLLVLHIQHVDLEPLVRE